MTYLMTAIFICGVALLSVGAWLAYRPAGFVVAGGLLVAVPVLWARGS